LANHPIVVKAAK